MGLLCTQIEEIERSVGRLHEQIPSLPVAQILASRLLVSLGRELAALQDQRLRPHGLNENEFRALMLVYNHRKSPAHPSNLCAGLAQSPANVTRLTDTLVERGLISRVPDVMDRRRLALKTTAQGEQLAELLMPHMMDCMAQSFAGFAPKSVDQLLALLRRLAQSIDATNEPARHSAQAQ